VNRISPTGYDVLEAPMPALVVCTQALGEPRYPSLKGIMAARSKELTTKALADVEGAEAGAATTAVVGAEAPPPRAATRVIREPADEAAKQVVAFLVERRIV
jgi:electron transfer flavoprotein beta subunit